MADDSNTVIEPPAEYVSEEKLQDVLPNEQETGEVLQDPPEPVTETETVDTGPVQDDIVEPAEPVEPVENHTEEPPYEDNSTLLPPPPPIEDEQPAREEEEEVSDDRPVIELFVKAAVDKMKNGGCPTCHRYFMVFYVLRERGLIDLVVTTFLPENPPKEVLEISNGKHYPLVKVHKGLDVRSQDMSGIECDTVDEIEALLERFDCVDMQSSKESKAESRAEKSFEDLYQKFMVFMKDSKNNSQPLIRCLEKVDAHLRDVGVPFMINEGLTRADCYVLPSLQHIRVAGKAYKNFEIPTELAYIWRYLKNSYEMDAFRESCPADREIIAHYEDRASCRAHLNVRRSQLLDESRTFSVPQEVANGQ